MKTIRIPSVEDHRRLALHLIVWALILATAHLADRLNHALEELAAARRELAESRRAARSLGRVVHRVVCEPAGGPK